MIERTYRQGLPLPKAIAEAPSLFLGLEFYLSAFWELNSSRSMGFGIGPLSWITMVEYCKAHSLDESEIEDFLYFIPRLDKRFIEYCNEKSKTK